MPRLFEVDACNEAIKSRAGRFHFNSGSQIWSSLDLKKKKDQVHEVLGAGTSGATKSDKVLSKVGLFLSKWSFLNIFLL